MIEMVNDSAGAPTQEHSPGDIGNWPPERWLPELVPLPSAELDASEVSLWRDRMLSGSLPGQEAAFVELLRGLEDLKSAAAAIQAKAAVAFDMARRQAEADAGLPLAKRGAGVAAEIALARRESPHRGGRLLGLAKALVHELPETLQALGDGTLNEWRATLVARETSCLEVTDRLAADAWLGRHLAEHPTVGDRRLVTEVRRQVIVLDQRAVIRRNAAAAGERRVTLRPLPDGMVQLTAVLPLRQGVAVYAALRKAAAETATPEPASPGARMADTLVERVTGRPAADPCRTELMVVITDQALLGVTESPANVDGYGPVPAGWVRNLLATTTDPDHQIAVRRLFRRPGRMVLMETSRRLMSPALRTLIAIRDQQCRTPWCSAPIRQTDHVHDHVRGGTTSLLNGQGLCEACNYNKQAPGWSSTPRHDPERGHVITVTTPTGHAYDSTQPTGPGDEEAPRI